MKKWVNDLILGSVILILALVLLVYSVVLENSWIEEFLARPGVYMALALGALALLALLLIIRAWRQRNTEAGQVYQSPLWTTVPIWTVGILLIYILLLDKLGFLFDSIWMLWALTFLYSINSKETDKNRHDRKMIFREAVKTGLFSVFSVLAVYFVFTKILSARLPMFDLL